jgi:hypothetical protein
MIPTVSTDRTREVTSTDALADAAPRLLFHRSIYP